MLSSTSAHVLLAILATVPAAGQLLQEDLKLTAFDAAEYDAFGISVAASGETALVGAYGDDDAGLTSGSVYLFDTTSGQLLYKLTADDGEAGDQFGLSVAISGTTAIVGAWRDTDAGYGSGSAYLFDTTTGEQRFKLTASDAAAGDGFGLSVAVSGTTAIVGARNDDDVGSAYLFDTTTGHQLFKLTASDAQDRVRFGQSVAISGTTAIVAAVRDDDGGVDAGAVYVFDTTTGQQRFKFTAPDASAEDGFGTAVAISGAVALIGSCGDDDAGSFSGSAYLFDTATGQMLFKITASDAAAAAFFGCSVAIAGTHALVGAAGEPHAGVNTGAAYLFEIASGLEICKLTASDAAAGDQLGSGVAISGTTVLLGADGDQDAGTFTGSAYLFSAAALCSADFNTDGVLDFLDVQAFLTAFATQDQSADFVNDDIFDIFDLLAFLQAFSAGCP